METRLLPEQMRTVETIQTIARTHGMNVYLTGGAIRDILTGYPIHDLDFTVQGNPLKLQRDIERAGGIVDLVDEHYHVLHAVLNGVRVEISMARLEQYDKPGKLPQIKSATINEDLRRRDFTSNAMALSLNEGSRGLLLDPFNGAADIEARLLRVLHTYAFLEDPGRLIRAIRFSTRFGWELEDRTRARYDNAIEGEYIQYLSPRAIGYEIEQIAHEENPLAVMKALEAEGWLKVLLPRWTVSKADVPELTHLLKTNQLMAAYGITADAAPAVMHFLTLRLNDADTAWIQKQIPHREFVAAWKRLEHDAKELSKKLTSREANTNSGTWKLLTQAKPEALLYLDVTGRNKTVTEKIRNFLGKWRQFTDRIPYAKMTELRITPQLPEYANICQEAFFLLLDGKLRSDAEIARFLAPFEPPPPPPPPAPVRRGRSAVKKPAVATPKPALAAPDSATQIAAQSVKQPAPVAVAKAESKPTKPEAKAAAKPVPAAKEVKKPVPPAAKPVKSAPAKPAAKPVARKAAKPAPKPVKKAAVKKAATKPAPKKVVPKKAAPKKAAKPAKKPAAKPAKKASKPEKKPAGKHGHKHKDKTNHR
jgi:tRNA nucleotidyltransferase/poly(A) polymerase